MLPPPLSLDLSGLPSWENNVIVQLERKFWHVKRMFLDNIGVIDHQVPYNLRNFFTQSTLKMINYINIK
jgi:hypothetical protein